MIIIIRVFVFVSYDFMFIYVCFVLVFILRYCRCISFVFDLIILNFILYIFWNSFLFEIYLYNCCNGIFKLKIFF